MKLLLKDGRKVVHTVDTDGIECAGEVENGGGCIVKYNGVSYIYEDTDGDTFVSYTKAIVVSLGEIKRGDAPQDPYNRVLG